jgi:hypothetical protein
VKRTNIPSSSKQALSTIVLILIFIVAIVFAVGTGIWPVLVVMGIFMYFWERPLKKTKGKKLDQ